MVGREERATVRRPQQAISAAALYVQPDPNSQ